MCGLAIAAFLAVFQLQGGRGAAISPTALQNLDEDMDQDCVKALKELSKHTHIEDDEAAMTKCQDDADPDCMKKAEKHLEDHEHEKCSGQTCAGEITFPPMADVDVLKDGTWSGKLCVPQECVSQQATYKAYSMKGWGSAYNCGPDAKDCSLTVTCEEEA